MEQPSISFSLGAVLSGGFGIYFSHVVSFTAISALMFVPLVVAYLLMIEGVLPPTTFVTAALAIGMTVLESLVALTLFQATWDAIHGRPASIRKSVVVASRRLLPALGVSVLSGLLIAIGLVFLVFPGIIAMVLLWVAIPVCLVERKGVVASMSRSSELVRGHGWEVFAILLVVGLIQIVPEKVLEEGLERGEVTVEAYLFVPVAISVFVSAATAAITAVGYQALRANKEPEEIERIAAVFD